MKVRIVEDLITTNSAGQVVESIPVFLRGDRYEVADGSRMLPIDLVEAADGIPVRIVTDVAQANSIGQPIDVTYGEYALLGILGTKFGPNGGGEGDGLLGDTGRRSATSRLRVDMPDYDVILKAVEYWNGYIKFNGAAEAAGPNDLTVKAAWESAAGVTTPLYAIDGVTRVASLNAGTRRLMYPLAELVVPGGSNPYVRQHVVAALSPWQHPVSRIAHGSVNSLGESDNLFGTNAGTDQVDATGTFGSITTASHSFGPSGIYGIPADGKRRRGVAIFGDSLTTYSGADGSPDYGDANGYPGFIERALTNTIATTAACRSSGRLNWVVSGWDNQIAMMLPYVTSAICALGRNDITNSRTLEQIQGDFATWVSKVREYGVVPYATTITPKPTASANSGVDGGSAISSAQEAVRIPYNEWLRTLPLGIAGCFDVAAAVEDPARPGYFLPASPAVCAADLTHLALPGMALAVAAIDGNVLA